MGQQSEGGEERRRADRAWGSRVKEGGEERGRADRAWGSRVKEGRKEGEQTEHGAAE